MTAQERNAREEEARELCPVSRNCSPECPSCARIAAALRERDEEIERLRAEASSLQADLEASRARAVRVLRDCEWSIGEWNALDELVEVCPCCGRTKKQGHQADPRCELAVVIGEEE